MVSGISVPVYLSCYYCYSYILSSWYRQSVMSLLFISLRFSDTATVLHVLLSLLSLNHVCLLGRWRFRRYIHYYRQKMVNKKGKVDHSWMVHFLNGAFLEWCILHFWWTKCTLDKPIYFQSMFQACLVVLVLGLCQGHDVLKRAADKPSLRIYNGDDADAGEFPFIVSGSVGHCALCAFDSNLNSICSSWIQSLSCLLRLVC